MLIFGSSVSEKGGGGGDDADPPRNASDVGAVDSKSIAAERARRTHLRNVPPLEEAEGVGVSMVGKEGGLLPGGFFASFYSPSAISELVVLVVQVELAGPYP